MTVDSRKTEVSAGHAAWKNVLGTCDLLGTVEKSLLFQRITALTARLGSYSNVPDILAYLCRHFIRLRKRPGENTKCLRVTVAPQVGVRVRIRRR